MKHIDDFLNPKSAFDMENQRSFMFLILYLNKIRFVYCFFYTLQVNTTGKRQVPTGKRHDQYFHRIHIASIAGIHFRVASNVEKSAQTIMIKYA